MNYQFLDPWHQFLPRQPGHVQGCMGSGGKTSLLLALADLYRREGIGTLLCTTTASEPLIQVSARQWRPDEPAPAVPTHRQLTTGDPERFADLAGRLFGSAFPEVGAVELGVLTP